MVPRRFRMRQFRYRFLPRFRRVNRSGSILYRRRKWREWVTPRRLLAVLVTSIAIIAISGVFSSSVQPRSTSTNERKVVINKIISDCQLSDHKSANRVGRFPRSMCGNMDSELILKRSGAVVVGFIRFTRAINATVSLDSLSIDIPITSGYFVFPSRLTRNLSSRFKITFSEPRGSTCSYNNVMAPGESDTKECVIP